MKIAPALVLLSLAAALAGCGVEPWVMPYERQNLADPIMSVDRDPVSSVYLEHVFAVREASRGAAGGRGGGCGCN